MAAASVAPRPTPLETTTNSPPTTLLPKAFGFPSSPTRSKPLRRTGSLRVIQQKSLDTDSPEAPDSPDSIYNAERVDSEEVSPTNSTFQLPPPAFPLRVVATQNEEDRQQQNDGLIKSLSSRSPPLGHSHWPEPRLDTILERSSTRSLRQSASAPRLQSSPERSAKYVKAQNSIHSIRPVQLNQSIRSPWPRQNPLPEVGIHRQHSFSMTDLDCLRKLRNDLCLAAECPSSPLTILSPMFPIKPKHPPPQFAITPEGLPAFGSKEAQQLRLNFPPERKYRSRILQWWLRSEHESEEHPSAASPTAVTSPTVHPEDLRSLERIKQMFGINRPVTAPDSRANPNPKAALPAGVTVATSPGVLAVAEDSTPIRGRFGTRASGHGVGNRSLDVHPLVRPRGQAAIEEQVREIDKACAQMNNGPERNHLRQLPQYPSIDSELQRHVVRAQRELGGRLPQRQPLNHSQESLRSPPMPPSNTPYPGPASPIMSNNTLDRSILSSRSQVRSGSSSTHMRGPR